MRATVTLAIACLLLPLAATAPAAASAVRAVHRWAYWQTPACGLGVCINVWDKRLDVYRADGTVPATPADAAPPR